MTSDKNSTSAIITQRLLIRASAGTGKTFQLSSRYIALLRNSSPEKILASTFTRKAAGEILERVLLRLSHAVRDPKSLKILADSVGGPRLSREECLSLLSRLTRQLHRVRISTLDSFFSQLAGSYALELGLPPGWRVLDPLEIGQIRNAAIEEMLGSGAPGDLVQLMHLLDKGQSSRNISRLITETINNLYYVFLAAPDESWERFPAHPFLSREHRETLRLLIEAVPLDKTSLINARGNDLEAILAEDWDGLLKRGLTNKIISGEMKFSRVPIPESLRGPYEELYQHVLANVSEPWKNQTLAARQLLRDYHSCFERAKLAAGGLEFGDVTRRLAESQQRSRLVDASFRLDASIDHLLLDEFQDTSPDQWSVIRSFAEEACRRPGRSLFCVGDPKQAIYGWRGGEAALFDIISEELPGEPSDTVELNLSYRSSPVIMETVNLAMRQLVRHDNLDDHSEVLYQWTKRFPEHRTARQELTGYACLRTLSDQNTDAATPDEEAEQPQQYWTEVAEYVRDRLKQAPGASIGILTRKNPTVGRLIFELTQLGIDASEEGGNPLTDSAAVQLILSLFTLADHPGHTVAAFHIANSPLGTILNWNDPSDSASRARFSAELRRQLIDRGYGGVVHDLLPKLAP
ncbi:MAG TPA: UvrD-helicase domain-containing protein, partial [Planctomicrobium sp.]|nr:UvrD-helicase domain-containing protein [Planctomicrobium sp.]